MKNFSKKLTNIFLLFFAFVFLTSGIFLIGPKKAGAVWGVSDIVSDPLTEIESTETTILENYEWVEDALASAEKMAMAYFRKSLMNYITQNIVAWGQGKDAFTTDFSFTDAIDVAGGTFLNELVGINFCGDWGAKIKISLAEVKEFKQDAVCTFSEIGHNFNDFMDDFNNGGWEGWIQLTESSNNPYSIYLDAWGEKLKKENETKSQLKEKTSVGGGFLGDEVCVAVHCADADGRDETWPYTSDYALSKEDVASYIPVFSDSIYSNSDYACECTRWEQRTPGKMMADMIGVDIPKGSQDWLGTNEEWESYVVAIVDSLMNALITKGYSAITAEDVNSEVSSCDGEADCPEQIDVSRGAPVTQSGISDAWHKSLDTTSTGLSDDASSLGINVSESVTIYYTTDGSEPDTEISINVDTTSGTLNYSEPVEITSASTLKWRGQNSSGYTEETNSESEEPPFATSTLSTAAAAVGSYGIVLRTNMPSAIYYTTDGSAPVADSSHRYIKKIDLSSSGNIEATIQWFGVSADGSVTETTHSISTTPPFPNTEFLKYSKYTSDGSGIGSVTASAGSSITSGYVTLNPSGSSVTGNLNKIIQYEWDFNDDGVYDWYVLDYDRDGEFEEKGCYTVDSSLYPTAICGSSNISSSGVETSATENAGWVKILSSYVGSKVKLMVTDANGFTDEADINVQ